MILTSKITKEIRKIVPRVLNSSKKSLQADTNELHKYFNKTKTCLIATKTHSKDGLKVLIESSIENNEFQLHTVSYEDVAQSLTKFHWKIY